MQEFITYLLNQIVTNPGEVKVVEAKEGDAFIYNLSVAQEDMGLVIGKEGRTIQSIRNLAKAKAIKDNVFVRVFLEDKEKPAPTAETTETETENPAE